MKRVLLRARSGPSRGMGHVMRSRAIAQAVLEGTGLPLLVVDDAATARALAHEPFEVVNASERPGWTELPATGAWLDGEDDWGEELTRLRARGTPAWLAENRGPARERCDRLVYPALHWVPDAWDRAHAGLVCGGAAWIPLAREVREARGQRDPAAEPELDLLITFGGSDPFALTERVLGSLDPTDLRIAVAVGPHMAERRDALRALVEDGSGTRVLDPGAPLGPWMARARMAVTALGTTLYELAYLGVPALVVANHARDRASLDHYAAHGPHLPLGIAPELSCEGLRAALRQGIARLRTAEPVCPPELGDGAARLAAGLMGDAARSAA